MSVENPMKIFIIHASAGAGHRKAGEALFEAAKTLCPREKIEIFDALDYTNRFFKWSYSATYLFAIKYVAYAWGFFYYILDFKPVYFLALPFRKLFNFLNSGKLRQKLVQEQPDVILCVHFFSAQVVARLIAKGVLKSKLITVLTDFLPHYVWINHKTHFYSVAFPLEKQMLMNRGVPEDKIKIFGIPVSPKFSEKEEDGALREKLGFEKNSFLILMVSGGFGVGPVEKMLHILDESRLDVEIAVVCGRNPVLSEKLKKINFKKKVTVFGFVDNMPQLMHASNLIITKSGGLSSSEALASGLPMIIVRPVPGQEDRNCRVLLHHKVGVKLDSLDDLENILSEHMKSDKREEFLKNVRDIAKPNAAFDIIEFAKDIGEKN